VGGRSRRFGADKATAMLAGRPLTEWAAVSLRGAADPILLLGGDEQLAERLALEWLPDAYPDAGPMSGVAAGLGRARELGRSGLLVLACDLPLVTSAVLRAIVAAAGPGVEAVVPTPGPSALMEPLCAWYGTAALPQAEAYLAAGERSMHGLIARLEARFLPCAAQSEDGEPLFLNVNTPQELARAEGWLARRVPA